MLPILPPAKFIRLGKYSSAYFTLGPKDARPLMLCHGLSASSLQFVTDAEFFADKGFYVIVPDLRGHGRSTCPDQRLDKNFSIKRLAADLIAILDAEEIDAIDWVGNSLGGIMALSLMGTDRARLKKYVSFGTSYSLSVPLFGIGAFGVIHKVLGARTIARIAAILTCKSAEARAVIYAVVREMDVDAVLRITRHLGTYDLSQSGLGFDGQMLMIQGERDTQVNLALKKTLPPMLELSNFERIKLPDAGHCANLDQPKKVRQLILDFLNS